jgi:AhpD family alkylhydroperoxidase
MQFGEKEINMLDEKTKELIAIGASVACNCQTCLLFHTDKAREMNIDAELIKQAGEVGRTVRKGAAGQMDKLLSGCPRE